LTFGNGGNGGLADTLYFTAGLNAETDGLFGAITPTPENGNAQGSVPRTSLTNGNVSHSAFVGNQAISGLLGGNGLGTGVPTPLVTPSLKIEASRVVDNGATGGAAGSGGSAGQGIGGGIYDTTAGVAGADLLTVIARLTTCPPGTPDLKVQDAYGNVVTGYTGTIHFTSTDTTATLPANYTLAAADKGAHTFTGLVLQKKGTQKITLTDTLNSSLTGSVIGNVL
jgi:hypothetical protein